MIRSVLVATFSAVVALGVLSGPFGAKSDVRADTKWPSVSTLGAQNAVPADTKWPTDTKWPSVAGS
ncbi:hypothetical protein AB0N77_02315 [Streptomyces misionensis]